MNRKTVDVVIPAHNYGRYLAAAITSALRQQDSVSRIIVVDDGSTDQTPKIAAEFAARHPNVSVITHHNALGLSATRRRGLGESSSDYVCFLDADDTLAQNYLGECIRAFTDGSVGFAYPSVHSFGSHHAFVVATPGLDSVLNRRNPFPSSCVVRRSALEAIGRQTPGLDAHGVEDWELWLRIVSIGLRGAPAPRTWLNYRRHPVVSANRSRTSFTRWTTAVHALSRANPNVMTPSDALRASAGGWKLALPSAIRSVGRQRRMRSVACPIPECDNSPVP